MYAVIKTGGKQYKVAEGDRLKIEKIDGAAGDVIAFDQVLMLGEGDQISTGTPLIEGAQVVGELVEVRKGQKITVFKKRRRQNYRRTKGHRQWEALVAISEIVKPGDTPKATPVRRAGERIEAEAAPAEPAPKPAKAEAAKPKASKTPKTPKTETKAAKPALDPGAATSPAPEPKPAAPAPETGDDLTQLKGIGPALQTKLNAAGVTRFAQIAAWTEAEMDALEGDIPGLKGKAEKGDWIAAAKTLLDA